MKIALVIPRFDPEIGGAERWTYDFARFLVERGEDVHVVSRSAVPLPGATIHRVAARALTAPGRILAFARAAETALSQLAADVSHDMGHGWSCDVLMPHGGTRGGSFRQNLRLHGRCLGWLKRHTAPALPRYRSFGRLEARQYAPGRDRIFVAISKLVARDMTAFHGVPAERLRVVYNGVDTERFQPAKDPRRAALRSEYAPAGATLFLIAAHNFRLKGVAALIDAVGRLAAERTDLRLLVLGGGDPRPFERQAARRGCAGLVRFVGRVSDPVPFYAAADVYVQPTFYDPCSLVALEALASGLPMITSAYNGVGELLTEGREGFVLDDPADAAALARAMRCCLDPAARAGMSHAARRLALEHTLERNAREILAVYAEAVERRKRRLGVRGTPPRKVPQTRSPHPTDARYFEP